eukprot:6170610-Pyramimonas_sp.AAC.1
MVTGIMRSDQVCRATRRLLVPTARARSCRKMNRFAPLVGPCPIWLGSNLCSWLRQTSRT